MVGYILLLFTLFAFASLNRFLPQYRKIFAISFSLFFIAFVGLRFDVGVDYFSYKEIFEERYNVVEIGYNFLNHLTYAMCQKYWVLTLITACIIVSCMHWTFWRYGNFYYSSFLYIMMSGGYAFAINGTRQALAAGFFFIAMSLKDKKWYILFWVISSCFHLSAIILFPFYWICNKKYPSKLCFCIFVIVFLTSLFFSYGNLFTKILSYSYYSKYVLMLDVYREIEANSTGLGFLFINLLGVIILYKSDTVLKLHPRLLPFMWAYFSFLVLRNLLADMPIFLRITIYFDYAMYIVIPYYVISCYKRWNRILAKGIISLLLFALFIKSISDETFNLKYQSILFVDSCKKSL